MKAIITIGISASGKTKFAEEYISNHPNVVNINRDDVRFELFTNGERDWSKYKFTKKNEELVTHVCRDRIQHAASYKRDVIISDTNLNHGHRENLISFLEKLGYEIETKEFPIELEEAWKRDARRPNGVGHTTIYRQWKQWLEYTKRKKYNKRIADGYKRPAVIVDIDGTVSEMDGRGPYEWNKVDTDLPVHHVMDIVDGLAESYHIIFLSGRSSVCYDKTRAWLERYFKFDFSLYMREGGDNRKDTIVKEELFFNKVVPDNNIQMVIDDRPSVCRMWRDIGLNVIQVSDPYVEF